MKTRAITFIFLFLVLGSLFLDAEAAPPQLINYQGKLINGTNLVSGQLSVVLRIYTNATMGSYLFEDSNTVTVVDGLYSVQLGAHPASGTLTAAIAGAEAWIEVEVNGTILSPRERILSATYALDSDKLDGLDSSAFATSAALTSEQNARVAADSGLGSSLSSETSARAAADASLSNQCAATSNALSQETSARIGADSALSNTTSALNSALTTESNNRIGADTSLSNQLATKLESNTWAAANSTTNFVRRTGDTMTGALTINAGPANDLVISSIGNSIMLGLSANGSNSGVAIGQDANGSDAGVAVGAAATGIGGGVGIGNDATGGVDGTAVGQFAFADNHGAAVGLGASGANLGVSVGYVARGADSGVGLGANSDGSNFGVGIGRLAAGSVGGVAVGVGAQGTHSNIAIGAYANAGDAGERIALGHNVTNSIDNSAAIRGTLYLDGGWGVYHRPTFGAGAWINLLEGLATGTPLYVFSETDPVWAAEKSGYATGTPLYAETDPRWTAASNSYYQKTEADGRFVDAAGDTMSGVLTINVGAQHDLIIDNPGPNVAIGNTANGSLAGAAVGDHANGVNSGAALGRLATADAFGTAVGYGANGRNQGAAMGFDSRGQDNGAVVGYQANAANYGATIGRGAFGYNRGATVGAYAQGQTYGAALGTEANGMNYGAAVGYQANASGTNIAAGYGANAALGLNRIAVGQNVTNTIDSSAALRGTLYLDGGTAVYYRATFGSGGWIDLLSGLATGTPLYAFTESDPVWTSEKSGYATGTPLYAESDPVWVAEKSGYATGTPVYAETDPTGTGYVQKVGDTMTGTLTVQTNVSFNYSANRGAGAMNMLTIGGGDDVEIGNGANGYQLGAAVGYQANGRQSGAAMGYQANGSSGAAIGYQADGGTDGAAVGSRANGHTGAAVGSQANGYHGAAVGMSANGNDQGVAVGEQANGYLNGTALGRSAKANNSGIAVGYQANGANANVAVGLAARASDGSERIAIGHGVTNENDNSIAVRGDLYIDGGTKIYYRNAFGAGAFSDILLPYAETVELEALSNNIVASDFATNYVRRTGDTMTGNLNINGAAGLVISSTSNNVMIGRAANAGDRGVAIGNNATGTTTTVAIGNNAAASSSGVAIGGSASAAYGVAIGGAASAPDHGVAVGESAGASHGVAVGAYAGGGNLGTAVGESADGSSSGATVGRVANGSSSGAAVGHSAHGVNYGTAIGYSANGDNGGAAVGYGANAWNSGLAVGNSAYAASTNIAIGYQANAGGAGATNRIAIGRGVINSNDNSAAIRGALYLDGGTSVYYRSTVGSGGWTELTSAFLPLDGSKAMTGDLDMGNHSITNVATNSIVFADGTILDPATVAKANAAMTGVAASNSFVKKTGDTMTGALTVQTNVSFIYLANRGWIDRNMITIGGGEDVEIGSSANGYGYGVAVGFGANGNVRGVAIGRSAAAASDGTVVGYTASGSSAGAAFGSGARGNSSGVAMGYYANGENYGVGIGRYANGAANIAIGYTANAQGGSDRIAIGHNMTNAVDNSAAIRGTLYLDGGTAVLYRTTFGSGGWTPLGGSPWASATQVLSWPDTIAVSGLTHVKVSGNAGPTDLQSNPQIADGSNGQIIIVQGTSDSFTVMLDDGDGLQLSGNTSFVLGANDTMQLVYDGTDWIEVSRSNN